MSEMVERVAQAISGSNDPANILSIHRSRARLAIEAMREPNQEMMNSGRIYILEGRLGEGEAEEVWRAMIDQALNGSKTPSE